MDTSLDLKPCGAGTAFAAADPRFGLLDRSGAVQMAVDGAAIQMHDQWLDSLSVSPDARQAAFALDLQGKTLVAFDLASSSLRPVKIAPPGFLKARTNGLGITCTASGRPRPSGGGGLAASYAATTRSPTVDGV